MTSKVSKVSRWPLIVGIVSAVFAIWFLTAAIRSLMTHNGGFHTNSSYGEQMFTVNPDGTPHDLSRDQHPIMMGERPQYITRFDCHFWAYSHTDMAADEYELNCFGLFGSPQSVMQNASYSVPSDNKDPEVYKMLQEQKELTAKRIEAKSAQDYRSYALRWTLLNSLMFLFFAAMALVWILRYRHLKKLKQDY